MGPPAIEDPNRSRVEFEDLPSVKVGLKPSSGTLAAVCVDETHVTRFKEPSSTPLRKNETLYLHTAVWCQEREVVDGVSRVHLTSPCDGWIDESDVVVGQVCVVNAFHGCTLREGKDLESPIVEQLPYETRVFVVERATCNGRVRARLVAPSQGWVTVKCLLPICDKSGDILAAGKPVVTKDDVDHKGLSYSHYVEIDHDLLYKCLWDTGLNYGPSFRNCKRVRFFFPSSSLS